MPKFYLTFLLSIILSLSYAQNNATIKGAVFDFERKPLEKATVSIVSEQDSIVLTYGLTNSKGEFDLVRIPTNKNLVFFISHVNSLPFSRRLNLKPNEKLNLDSIILGGNSIEEIQITVSPPIRMNGDTLEYKAEYFKTRPNATVEELLSILPGLQVNADGSIIYQGREVTGIRVNNKDFFAQDLKIATKNLDASLIDIVQVIKDKGESKREIIDDSELPIVLNLKMKKEFLKANFGKFYGGAATRDRYESGALVNTFRDTLQVSFIGFANNINRQGFDYSELSEHGGMGRAENHNYVRYGNNGLMNQISAGINVNYDIKKKLKTNLMYNFRQNDFYDDSENNSEIFLNDIQENSTGKSNNENQNSNHELRALIRYHIDTTSQISYSTNLNNNKHTSNYSGSSNRWRGENIPILEGNNNSVSNNHSNNFNHNFNYEKKFKNKWFLSINNSISSRDGKVNRDNITNERYYLFNDSLINQHQILNSTTGYLNLENRVNIQIPIKKKANIDFYGRQIINNQKSVEDIQNKVNSDIFQDRNDIANNKGLKINTYQIGTRWNITAVKDLPITLGIKWHYVSNYFDYYQKLENIRDNNTYWLPDLRLSFKGFVFQYERSVENQFFNRIITVDSDLSPTYTTLASPYFENSIHNKFSVRYQKTFTKSKINFSTYISQNNESNSIGNISTYNIENSFSTNGAYQSGPTKNRNFNFSLSKTFLQNKDWNLSYRTYVYASIFNNYAIVNGEENKSDMTYGSWNNTITFSYKKAFTFTPMYAYGLNSTKFKFSSENFRNVNNDSHSIGATLLLNNVKKFRLESSYTIKNQVAGVNDQRQNLHLINASIYYPVFGKGELKLSAFDILNQNVSNYYGSGGNRTYFFRTSTLRQYFMLGLVYKFLTTDNKK